MMGMLLDANKGALSKQGINQTLPLHALCKNPALTADLVKSLVGKHEAAAAKLAKDGRTPLHYLCNNFKANVAMVQCIIRAYPGAAKVRDKDLRIPFHWLCANPAVTEDLVECLLKANPNVRPEKNRCSAKCKSRGGNGKFMEGVIVHTYRDGTYYVKFDNKTEDKNVKQEDIEWMSSGENPLHVLCANRAVEASMLLNLMNRSPGLAMEKFGKGNTPLHILCANPAVKIDFIKCLLQNLPEDDEEDDSVADRIGYRNDNGDTSLHKICQNSSVTAEIVRYMFESANDGAEIEKNRDELTPYRLLSDNPSALAVKEEMIDDTFREMLVGFKQKDARKLEPAITEIAKNDFFDLWAWHQHLEQYYTGDQNHKTQKDYGEFAAALQLLFEATWSGESLGVAKRRAEKVPLSLTSM